MLGWAQSQVKHNNLRFYTMPSEAKFSEFIASEGRKRSRGGKDLDKTMQDNPPADAVSFAIIGPAEARKG
jgi:hypothetical protein